MCRKLDESQKPNAEQRKPDAKVYIPYDSIYMKAEGRFSDRRWMIDPLGGGGD